MDKHITLLAVLHIVYHALGLVGGVFVFVFLSGAGILSQDPQALAVLSFIGTAIGTLLLVLAAPGIIGAIGLLKRKSWARILLLVVGFLSLANVPVGTALGVYTFWVLMQDESSRMLS